MIFVKATNRCSLEGVCLVKRPKAISSYRVWNAIIPDLFEALTLGTPNDLWLSMALTMSSGDKDKQRCQVGAFAAGKKIHTTSDESDGKLQRPSAKPQDRGQFLEHSDGEA